MRIDGRPVFGYGLSMTTDDNADELTEDQKAFFARHAHEARRDPTRDFWWMQPLCPPATLDALDAFRQLHGSYGNGWRVRADATRGT